MPAVTRRRSICSASWRCRLPSRLASPPAPGGRPRAPAIPPRRSKPAQLSVHVHGARNGKVKVGKKVRAVGYLRPFVRRPARAGEALRSGHVIERLNPKVRRVRGQNAGRYRFRSPALIKPAGYRIVARHQRTAQQGTAVARSPSFHIYFPNLDPGDRNSAVRIFNRLLLREGYCSTRGKRYSQRTGLRGHGLPQDQRDEPHLQRQRRDLQAARRRAGWLPASSTPAPASTWRSTSPGR